MATPRVINRQLDPAVLQQMEEPITVSVSRLMGAARTPIPLPAREDGGVQYGPGDGWEKSHIQQLEAWLVTDFAGGGLYNIKIVDAKGLAFEWQPYFDPKTYPIKIPATMQPSMVQQQQPQQSAVEVADWPPRNLPGSPFISPIQNQVPMSFPMFPYTNVARVSSADEDRRRFEDEKRQLSERLANAERERLEEKHRADLNAIRAENDRKLDELKAAMAAATPKVDDAMVRRLDKLEDALTQALNRLATPSGPSPEFLAMQEANRKLEAKIEADAAERRHSEQLAALERRIDAQPKGPDPMLTMLTETMKDERRQMQSVIEGMNRQMLTPQDVLNLAKSTSSGLDDLRTGVVRTFQEIFELQKRAFESAAQMLPQGESPAVRIIEQGVEKAGEMFEKWQESKDAGAIASAKATAAQARAAEAQINAQREQLNEMARREERLSQQAHVATANAAHRPAREEQQIGGGLAGAAPVPPNGQGNVIPFNKPPERRLGKTDEEWFGGAISHVARLRVAVAMFLDGIAAEPNKLTPDGKPVGTDPVTAASFVLSSTEQIVKGNLPVLAFSELYLQDRLEDFAMVLLPEAPLQYRNAMIEAIEEQDDGEGDDDEQDGEDDAAPDDEKKEAAAPAAADKSQAAKAGAGAAKRPPRPPQPRA